MFHRFLGDSKMKNELYELKYHLKNAITGSDYLNLLIKERESDLKLMSESMNRNNLMYICGAIDALFYANKITQEEYTKFLKYFGL
jgi:hypothetical protein